MYTTSVGFIFTLLLTITSALQLPNLQPFLDALPHALQDYLPVPVANASAHEVLRRQDGNTCPSGFNSCQNLGVPGLCCIDSAVCSPDQAGNVACCPSGAVCTGTITGVIRSGTVGNNGQLVGATGTAGVTQTMSFQLATTTNGNGLVQASTQPTAGSTVGTVAGGGGFIINGQSTVATPGAAMRAVQPPFIARAIIELLQYLPI